MKTNAKISLTVPNSSKSNNRYSFVLKSSMNNERSEYQSQKRLVVLSNLDGNFKSFCKILYKNKIINRRLQWKFEDNHLIILGDCFTHGEEIIECLWLIYALEEKAKKKGGYVHFILGKREILNLNGEWRHLHPNYAVRKSGHATALYDGNNELWRWLRTKNIVEKIGDMLFVSAGLVTKISQFKLTVTEINELMRHVYTNKQESIKSPLFFSVFEDDSSGFISRLEDNFCWATQEDVNVILNHFKVRAVIIGHYVMTQADVFSNGGVIIVNSSNASNNSEGLLISMHRFYRVPLHGNRQRIYVNLALGSR